LRVEKDSLGNRYYFCPNDELAPIAIREKYGKLRIFSNAFGKVAKFYRPVLSWDRR
jgi:hypothetical protein